MARPLAKNWDVIRLEFANGLTLADLAKKYNIKWGTLAARSSREKWMQTRPETHAKTLQSTLVEVAKSQGESLAEAGRAYQARMFKKISSLAESANLAPPKSWKDLEVADKVARRAAGLDTADVMVNTVVGVGTLDDYAPVFEGEFVKSEPVEEASTE